MATIKEGDVVRLRTGGPEMTVSHRGGTHGTATAWFDNDGALRRMTASKDAFILVRKRSDKQTKPE